MQNSFTSTQTSTYTEARARYVMDKVFEDLTAIVVRGFTTQEKIKKWKEDLLYIMGKEALAFFDITLKSPGTPDKAIRYYVKADNSLSQDADSGNLGLYSLPSDTTAGLFAELKYGDNYQEVHDELHNNRGWGYGQQTPGSAEQQQHYSKEGYGVSRNRIGTW